MTRDRGELWRCPECGEQFTTRNQWHSCGRYELEPLFARSEPQVRLLYDRFAELVQECGPVTIIPQKSRVAFQVRMRFAAVTPQKECLLGHLILASPQETPCFEKVESFGPRSHRHVFRLRSEEQMGEEFRHWIREAYRVGRREHLNDGTIP